ncbi:TSSK6-activating co-chaperone protein isoform X1 [Hyaena hyaena]|uniref:TSSK6-activating co-chaperone protein isoform X1 n=1 Tax=Hyaena hyaena TaxID=95912 RepID=UPI0019240680|nr:TSSK6-activating co-chaperone protein isoform X1 [Hyaena hyaena]XP_039107278.1 TSSK6-activating co-chaperone protein isoform X1 [Hyaena hyaena]
MEQCASHPKSKAKEESNAVPLCRAKPSPSFINLQASSPPATFLSVQTAKLPSGIFAHRPSKGACGSSCAWKDERVIPLEPSLPRCHHRLSGALCSSVALPSGVDPKPKECLGLLECMYANLQLQTQLAQQQMAILENLQASMTQLAPVRGSKSSSLPALSRNLLLNRLPQFRK